MVMERSRILALTILVAPVVACSDGVTGPAAGCTDDTGSVTVTVSGGSQPVFNWTPACSVAFLLIEEDAADLWGVSTDDALWDNPAQANLIAPPVTYGVVPTGTEQLGPPEALVPGVTYEVVLWRVLPVGSSANCMQRFENVCLLVVHEFTR